MDYPLKASLSYLRFYDLRQQFVNKRTKILPLATSFIANAHLRNQFNHIFALLISMSHLKSINFYQNRPKSYFSKKY